MSSARRRVDDILIVQDQIQSRPEKLQRDALIGTEETRRPGLRRDTRALEEIAAGWLADRELSFGRVTTAG